MPKKAIYRLEALLKVKVRQKRKTEQALARALQELEEEKSTLERLEKKREEIHQKKKKTRQDMRNKVNRGELKIRQSEIHLGYIAKLDDDCEKMDLEITEQKEVVSEAETKLKRARRDYVDAATDLNMMEKHKDLWKKKQAKMLSAIEDKELNELGNTLHQLGKMKGA